MPPEPPTGPAELPASTPELVRIADAPDRWHVSLSTLRRRVRAGELAGAVKRAGRKGSEWWVPADTLDDDYDRLPADAGTADTAGLAELAQALTAMLETEQKALMEANRARTDATAEAARLAERADNLQAERRRLMAQADSLATERDTARAEAGRLAAELVQARAQLEQARRRWWRRST